MSKNSNNENQEIFKDLFKESWNEMPQVMHKHYANRAFSQDLLICEGLMEIKYNKFITFLSPLFSLLKILIPKQGHNIFSRVTLRSSPTSNTLAFEREIFFEENNPLKFFSHMIPLKNNEVVEVMNYGICWRFF